MANYYLLTDTIFGFMRRSFVRNSGRLILIATAGIFFSMVAEAQPANDNCSGAITLTVGAQPVTGNVLGATQSISAINCGGFSGVADDDVWYKFTTSSAGNYVITVTGSASFDAVIDLRSGACNGSNIACADATISGDIETISASLSGSTAYLIRVYDYDAGTPATTTFTISVDNANPCLSMDSIPGCGTPVTAQIGSGSGLYDPPSSSCLFSTPGHEKIFSFTPAVSGVYSINVSYASTTDYIDYFMKAGPACGSSGWTCISDFSGTGMVGSVNLTGGVTYYVLLDAESTLGITHSFYISCPLTNDGPCSAINLGTITSTCNSVAGDVNGATETTNSMACAYFATTQRDVWYKFTASGTIANVVVVSNGDFNAVVQAYSATSCSGTLTSIGCANYWIGNQATEVLHLTGLTNGVVYYVRVFHDSSTPPANTTFTICAVIPPANDDCPGTTLTLNAALTNGTTVNASQSTDDYYSTGYDDDEVWYNFTASGATAQIIMNGSASLDGILELRTTAACPAFRIVAHDFTYLGGTETINVTGLTSGANYKVRVFSYSGGLTTEQAAFTIGANNTGYVPSGNDNVANAMTATVGTTIGNSYVNYGFEVGEPSGANWAFDPDFNTVALGNTAWFKFTPSASGSYTISTNTGGNAFEMAVYSATNAATLLSGFYAETGSSTGTDLSNLCLTSGTTYFIQINGHLGLGGTPAVTITNNSAATPPTTTAATNQACTSFTANWGSVANANGYYLDVSSNNFSSFVSGYNSLDVGNVTSANVTVPSSGTYQYRVRAYGACSSLSGNSNVTIVSTLSTPTTPVFTAGSSSHCIGDIDTYTATSSVTVTYSIVGGTGATINSTTGDVTNITGNFTVRATATNACGTVSADFSVAIPLYSITASAGPNGTISPPGVNNVMCGNFQGYTITANPGYHINDVLVNGSSVGAVSSYTFINIHSNQTISVSFDANCSAPSLSSIVTNVFCFGGSNGAIALSTSGGTGPFTYLWSNGQTTQNVGSLATGVYAVTVSTSAGSCRALLGGISVTQPSALVATSTQNTVISCNGGTASVTVSASGGTPVYSGTGTFTVAAGVYSYTVTDANQCKAITSITITEPVLLNIVCGGTNISCRGVSNGTASVTTTGGTPAYAYIWNTGATATTITSLTTGTYSVTVTDSKGCKAACSSSVSEPSALSISSGSNSPVCYDSTLTLTSSASGGTPAYSYSWTGPNGFTSSAATPSLTHAVFVNAGTYSLTVTDAKGCTITTATTVSISVCSTVLNLTLFIEGYYFGSSRMLPVMFKQGVPGSTSTQTDTILVALRNGTSPTVSVDSAKAIVSTTGVATVHLKGSVYNQSCWIVVKHRNTIQTWSAAPVLFGPTTSYNFTTSASQAYGNNMIEIESGRWAFYNGDINQDTNIDLIDFPALDSGIVSGLSGYYATDLNGDDNVDLIDFPLLDANINLGIFSRHP